MNAETRLHLFEPFYTTKELGKGTGLGLTTIYGIVKQANGHIRVESSEGKGTTFHIHLPIVDDLAPQATVELPPSAKTSEPITILIVEDETSLRRLLCLCLEKRNHTVLAAKDGLEALEVFRERAADIDLVVTDLVMPRMDGLELRNRVLALRPDVKFLFMSGYAEHILEQHPSEGCLFLEKPFLPEELAKKVASLMAGDVAA